MTFHSKSVVSFGQLLNNLTTCLTDGSPIPAALDVVKEHFSAQVVVLRLTSRGDDDVFACDSGSHDFSECVSSYDCSGALADLTERYQHVTACELGDADGVDYAVWIFRDREAARFDHEAQAMADVVIAQIGRALDLASRIDSNSVEKALYSSALDRLHIGVIIADESGKVVKSSDVAGRLLAERDGLQVQTGKLRAASASEDRELQALFREVTQGIADGCQTVSRGLSLTKQSGARTLGVVIRPVNNPPESAAGPLIAIYLRDTDTNPEVESDFVRQIFDLTPAEAAVTHRLAAGLSLDDVAASLAISRNTARAHLRSIFSKSGITRQTELVRLVLNSAVPLGGQTGQAA